jgi:site-specific DNA-adenine methylase
MLNINAIDVIKAFSNQETLVYCDPPELHSSEMDSNKHIELSEILKSFRGKAIISAHNSATYKRLYKEWNRKGVPNKPKESIWLNF